MAWGTALIFDRKRFARKYALRYAALIAVIMLVPLFVYTQLMLSINEAKIRNDLTERARHIVLQMEGYNPQSGEAFHFPRYSGYDAGLYDNNMRRIFSLLPFTPSTFTPGYHEHGGATM